MKKKTHRRARIARLSGVPALLLLGALLISSDSAGSPLAARAGLPSPRSAVPAVATATAAASPAPFGFIEPAAYVRDLPYGEEIAVAAQRHGVDALLVASVIEAESSFRPDAVSPKGALGLMQVMPFHLEDGDELLDPEENLEVGASYLSSLLVRYDGDLALGLAAYHAGPGAVDRYDGVPPYRTTRAYVAKVLTLYEAHLEQLALDSDLG